MSAQELRIPIPEYPSFKLRSSLIDKDPVIWVHLLEGYIRLFQVLCQPKDLKLAIKSQQELYQFLRVYLRETNNESSQIFSLGSINPDIKANTATLRVLVFHFIKLSSFVKCNLLGQSAWEFISIYVGKNCSTVRQLVDGSFKSKLNDNKKSGTISSIGIVQNYLQQAITNGNFTSKDLLTLSLLLGQQIGLQKQTKFSISGLQDGQQSTVKADKIRSNRSIVFSQQFINVAWIEMLEGLYVKGKSVHAKLIEKIMIISLISLSPALITKLLQELSITSVDSLKLYPLVGTILISDSFQELVPNLHSKLPFLQSVTVSPPVDEESILMIQELFPQVSHNHAKNLLEQHDRNVERVTNLMFEQPELLQEPEPESPKKRVSNKPAPKRSIYDGDKISQLDFQGTKVIVGKQVKRHEADAAEDVKKKTLEAALKLMYESDEDEPDDTYEEVSTPQTGNISYDSKQKKPHVSDNEPDVRRVEDELFSLYKTNGEIFFTQAGRNLIGREQIRKITNWSNEQIEGWYTMLKKSPKRLDRLEHSYMLDRNRKDKVELSNKVAPIKDKLKDQGSSGKAGGKSTTEKSKEARKPKPKKK